MIPLKAAVPVVFTTKSEFALDWPDIVPLADIAVAPPSPKVKVKPSLIVTFEGMVSVAPGVFTVTAAVETVSVSAPASPKVVFPAELNVNPSRVTLPFKVVAVSPAATVTLS